MLTLDADKYTSAIMERIKIIVFICACICVRCVHPLTVEELMPLLETLKAGIRSEMISEIQSKTAELSNNIITTGEIVSVIQNQDQLIKDLTKELNETEKNYAARTNTIELNQREIKGTIEAQALELNYLKNESKGAIKNLNETQVVIAELENTIVGLEEYNIEIKAAIGNQSNAIESTQGEIKGTIDSQTIELYNLKQGLKEVVKELNETQFDVTALETTINQLEVAIGNQSYQFNEFQMEFKGIQDKQENIGFLATNHSETLHGLVLDIEECEKNQNKNQAIVTNHTEQLSGLKTVIEGLKTGQTEVKDFIEEHSNQIGAIRLEQNKTRAVINENSSGLDDLEADLDEMKEGKL